MLLEECRLDLVSKATRRGKGVGGYFARYAEDPEARLVHGRAEERDVIGVMRGAAVEPEYIILLDWDGDQVSLIRDYRYVPYLVAELRFERLPAHGEDCP